MQGGHRFTVPIAPPSGSGARCPSSCFRLSIPEFDSRLPSKTDHRPSQGSSTGRPGPQNGGISGMDGTAAGVSRIATRSFLLLSIKTGLPAFLKSSISFEPPSLKAFVLR